MIEGIVHSEQTHKVTRFLPRSRSNEAVSAHLIRDYELTFVRDLVMFESNQASIQRELLP